MNRAQELRADFDRSFAQAEHTAEVAQQDFLTIRIGASPYAIRLADITGIFADRRITRLPSTDPTFLGIAGLRGAVVPVYELGAFLGCPPGEAWRWLLLIGGARVALAFESFDGHVRVPRGAVGTHMAQQRSNDFVQGVLHAADPPRPIVQVSAIFQTIERTAQGRVGP